MHTRWYADDSHKECRGKEVLNLRAIRSSWRVMNLVSYLLVSYLLVSYLSTTRTIKKRHDLVSPVSKKDRGSRWSWLIASGIARHVCHIIISHVKLWSKVDRIYRNTMNRTLSLFLSQEIRLMSNTDINNADSWWEFRWEIFFMKPQIIGNLYSYNYKEF